MDRATVDTGIKKTKKTVESLDSQKAPTKAIKVGVGVRTALASILHQHTIRAIST